MWGPSLFHGHFSSDDFRMMRHILYPNNSDPKTYGEYLRKKNHGRNHNRRKKK